MISLELEDLVAGSDFIIIGTVAGQQCSWNARNDVIYTALDILVSDRLKGDFPGEQAHILLRGGKIGQVEQRVSDVPAFTGGETVMLFLRQLTQGELASMGVDSRGLAYFKVYGNSQGALRIAGGKVGSVPVREVNDAITAIISGVTPGLKMDGMTSAPGTAAGWVSGATAVPSYVYNNHRWTGASPVVNYYIKHDAGADNITAIQNSTNSWNAAGANFTLNYAGTHTNTDISFNGINEIVWGNEDAMTLACAYLQMDGGGNITECDIRFNKNKTWINDTPPTNHDVETIALHEFGHWLCLEHNDIPEAVMYYIANMASKRSLHNDDASGIRNIYGTRTGATPLPPALSYPGNNEFVGKYSISLSWSAVAGASNYEINIVRMDNGALFHNDYTAGFHIE